MWVVPHYSSFKFNINLDSPANDTRATIFSNTSDGRFSIQLHLNKVYPIPNCTITLRVSDPIS